MTEISIENLTTKVDTLENQINGNNINYERAFEKLSAILLKITKLKKTNPTKKADELYSRAFRLQYKLTILINKLNNAGF